MRKSCSNRLQLLGPAAKSFEFFVAVRHRRVVSPVLRAHNEWKTLSGPNSSPLRQAAVGMWVLATWTVDFAVGIFSTMSLSMCQDSE